MDRIDELKHEILSQVKKTTERVYNKLPVNGIMDDIQLSLNELAELQMLNKTNLSINELMEIVQSVENYRMRALAAYYDLRALDRQERWVVGAINTD